MISVPLKTVPLAKPVPRIPQLDGLRFVAAALVMFGHAVASQRGLFSPFAFNTLVGFANAGMSLFFVLSGFVLTYNYGNLSAQGRAGVWRFGVARVARILPLYFLFLAGTVAMFGAERLSEVGLLTHLTLTQTWISFGRPYLFQQLDHAAIAWSISTEWFFYCAFLPVSWLAWRARDPLRGAVITQAGLLAIMTGVFFLPSSSAVEWLGYYSPYIRILEFVIGCLVCRAALMLPPAAARERSNAFLFPLAAGILALVALETFAQPGATVLAKFRWAGGFTPVAAILMFWSFRYGGALLASRAMAAGGDLSYGFYLFHVWCLLAATAVAGRPATLAHFAPWLALALAMNVALSAVVFRFFERPARAAIRRALLPAAPTEKGATGPLSPAPPPNR